jgi:hypothetical protein
MVYHLRITRKSNPSHDLVELDLSKNKLVKRIIEPFMNGESFYVSGTLVYPSDVETIRINETNETSDKLLPIIRERRKLSTSAVIGISDEWYVTKEGVDVTHKFIKNSPFQIKPEKTYREGSIMDFAVRGFEKIKNLSRSQKVTDKLIGFNSLLVVIILSLSLTDSFFPNIEFSTFLLGLAFLSLLVLAGMSLYIPFIEVLLNFAENKISGLKFSISLLFLSLLFISVGISFKLTLAKYFAYTLLALQIFILPFSSIFPKSKIENKEITFGDLWNVLGKIDIVIGIISGLISIILFIYSFLLSLL